MEELCLPVPVDSFKYLLRSQHGAGQGASSTHSGAMGGPLCQNQARRASTGFEISIIAPGARDDWLAEVVLHLGICFTAIALTAKFSLQHVCVSFSSPDG
jgi:hypothetical protein